MEEVVSNNRKNNRKKKREIIKKSIVNDIDYKFDSSNRSWKWKKWIFVLSVWFVNASLIVLAMFTKWGIYIIYPFIALPHVRDVCIIIIALGALVFKRYRAAWGPCVKLSAPPTHVTMTSLVTCYSEKYSSVKDNINNLMSASMSKMGIPLTNIVVCVCDGNAVGKENDASLADIFTREMKLLQPPIIRWYETWKGDICKSTILYGLYGKHQKPMILVKKQKNHGKKDSLLLGKGIMNDINSGKYQLEGLQLPIKYVYSTDADTVTENGSIERCVEWMEQYPEVDGGVCVLRVKFQTDKKCNWFWDPLQHYQYFSSQYIRRNTESIYAKVTCLSGSGNICRISSEAYHYANKRYAEYPKTTSIMDVVPKMIGTDRRYTTLKLKYSRDVKLVMFYDTFVETETPQDFGTYVSQRKRWGTNTLSNSLVNISSKNLPWFTKLSSIVDIFRWIASYYRFASYFYFMVFIALRKVNLPLLIFVGGSVGFVYIYSLLLLLIVGHRKLTLLYGFFLNKLLNPLLSVRIFTEILLNFDDFAWGKTQQIKHGTEVDVSESESENDNDNSENDKNSKINDIESGNNRNNEIQNIQHEQNIDMSKVIKKYEKYETIEGIRELDEENIYRRRVKLPKEHQKPNIKDTFIRNNRNNNDHYNTNGNNHPINILTNNNNYDEIPLNDIPTTLNDIDNYDDLYSNDLNENIEIEYKLTPEWLQQHFPSNEITVDIPISTIVPPPPPLPPPMAPPPPLAPPMAPPPPLVSPLSTIQPTIQPTTTKKRRKLHWKPIEYDFAKDSFWKLSVSAMGIKFPLNELQGNDRMSENNELNRLFEIYEIPKALQTKIARNILVSHKRANNAGILLAKIRRRFIDDESCLQVIIKSLTYLTTEHISTNQLVMFIGLFPLEDEEIERIKEYQSKNQSKNQSYSNDLIFPDKFFIQSLLIPRMANRIKSEYIKRTLQNSIKHIHTQCIIRQNACIELKENKSFRKILTTILKYGKLLNDNSSNHVIGFKLESLKDLKHIKANKITRNNNEKNQIDETNQMDQIDQIDQIDQMEKNPPKIGCLLDFIIDKIAEKDVNVLYFYNDFIYMKKMDDNTMNNFIERLKEISEQRDFLNSEITYVKNYIKRKSHNEMKCKLFEIYLQNYDEFAITLSKNIDELSKIVKETENIIRMTMRYYGEKYPETTFNEFISMIHNFIIDMIHSPCYPDTENQIEK